MSANQSVERQWLRQVAGGDRAAFEQLYRGYHKRIFGYLFRRLASADAAEELTTDVLVEVWKSAGSFRGESEVSTWIFGIARLKSLSFLRRPRRESVAIDEAERVPDQGETQDEALVRKSMTARIKGALGRLSAEHREVMELTFFEGFSYPEIAKLLGCPVNTVKTRMFYARKQLRELLGTEAS